MTRQDKEELVSSYYSRMDEAKGDFQKLNDLFNADMKFHFPGIPTPLPVEGFQGPAQAIYAGFEDFKHEIDDLIIDEDKIACRLSITGTHSGEFQGIPASGKPIAIGAITAFRIKDNRLSEHWVSVDLMGMMSQIGAIPKS